MDNHNSKLMQNSAKKLNIPFISHDNYECVEIRLGAKRYYHFGTTVGLNRGTSTCLQFDKYVAHFLLQKSLFPVPKTVVFSKQAWKEKSLNVLLQELSFPVVAKPLKGTSRGEDVFCKIPDSRTLNQFLNDFFNHYDEAKIEEFIGNLNEYRVLAMDNKVIGVIKRTGAQVIGDGKSTIQELIDEKNVKKNLLHQYMTVNPLVYDMEYKQCLIEQNLDLESIPLKGQSVRLTYTVNGGRGGDIYSFGDQIHSYNAKLLIKAMRVLNRNYVGFDILCEDINRPFDTTNPWYIIEANIAPDLTIHELTPYGIKIPVTELIIKKLLKKHPFSYLLIILKRRKLSKYFKIAVISIILIIIYTLSSL